MRQDNLRAIARGATAGLIGTITMSAAMALMQRLIPRKRREDYEPRQVVEGILEQADLDGSLEESEKKALTAASHLGYGAAMGVLYEDFAGRLPLPAATRGPVWGLAVWGASYCGWLPALGIMKPAHQRPAERNALMIVAHLVWGATTEIVSNRWKRRHAARKRRRTESRRRRTAAAKLTRNRRRSSRKRVRSRGDDSAA